jgi:UDP-N-acetylglucosamine 3-dehydrogenase
MMGRLRVGIIGAGRIVELGHLPGFVKAGAEVVALCGQDQANLDRLADKFQVRGRYTDWHDLLAAGGLDAVSICTPPALHCEMSVASAEHGYHTLVEKPMALTLQECDQMARAGREAGILLMVAHNQRFSARHLIAKEILRSGRLGKAYTAHAVFAHGGPELWSPAQKWYFDADKARYGVLADLGCHKIDLLRWLLNQEVTEVTAFKATNEKPTTVDDTAIMALRFSEGTLGTIQASWVFRPGLDDSVSICCERGVLHVPSNADHPVTIVERAETGSPVESTYPFSPDDVPGWFGMAAAFVDAVDKGTPSPVPGEEGRATMAAVLAAYESVTRQTVVRPPNVHAVTGN